MNMKYSQLSHFFRKFWCIKMWSIFFFHFSIILKAISISFVSRFEWGGTTNLWIPLSLIECFNGSINEEICVYLINYKLNWFLNFLTIGLINLQPMPGNENLNKIWSVKCLHNHSCQSKLGQYLLIFLDKTIPIYWYLIFDRNFFIRTLSQAWIKETH